MKPTPLVPSRSRCAWRALLGLSGSALLLWLATGQARAQDVPVTPVPAQRPSMPAPLPEPLPPELPPLPPMSFDPLATSGRTVPVVNTIGSIVSVSQGEITQADIRDKPLFRTTDFLEQIPGFIITTETAGIDANTMYLRGFLIDHGTDFAFFIDGMPMNLDSNAHAQGYTDLQSVIPELISFIDFGKGPYYAKVGNFSAVGYEDTHYVDALPYGIAKIEAGQYDWFRAVVANSGAVGQGTLLYGVQFNYFDNAYEFPEQLNKYTGILRYTMRGEDDKLTLSASAYNGQTTAEPVVPLRLVQSGQVSPFVNLSPTDFIVASRFTANAQWEHHWDNGALTQGNVYGYHFSLNLIENPSGFDDDGVTPAQISQIDQRWVTGVNLSHSWNGLLLGDQCRNTVGLQVRHDAIGDSAVYNTVDRVPTSANSHAEIDTTDTGIFYQNEFKWSEKVRTVVGLRGEFYSDEVTNILIPQGSGSASTKIFLPKGSLILGPWDKTEFYLDGGYSFHSNNAEGVVGGYDTQGNFLGKSQLLSPARGAEVGVRTQAIPGLTTSMAMWQLHSAQELVFDPAALTTVPLRSSDRWGFEWTSTYHLPTWNWFTLNADYAASHGRLLGIDPDVPGQHIPEAPTTIFSGGPGVNLPNGLFANLRYRYWGPRYLIEDGSQSSRATNLFELSTGYQCQRYTINLQILNLFNSNGHDIDFYDTTFYPNHGDTAPVNDILYKPLQPIQARLSFTLRW